MTKHLTEINQVRLHYKRPLISNLPKITHPSTAIEKLRLIIDDGVLDLKEHYWVLLLTADNRLLGISEINSGTIVGINFFAREILQLALLANAVGIVLVHNHPSGSLTPSKKDIDATEKIREIGMHFDIHLRDHLIITSEDFISIRSKIN